MSDQGGVRQRHVVFASHEVAPLVSTGGIGRHVAYAAELLAEVAEVTVVVPSGLREAYERAIAANPAFLGEHRELHVVEPDPAYRERFASSFHADAAEMAAEVDRIVSSRSVDLVEVDDYLGLGAVLVDVAATQWRGSGWPPLAVRLHTTWEMSQVLNGQPLTSAGARWVCALERRGLRAADVLLAPSEATAEAYARFYGAAALARMEVLPPAVKPIDRDPTPGTPGGPLRILYAGRLEQRKGVYELVASIIGSDLDVELRLAGGDTTTGPGGASMREHLIATAQGDRRVRFLGPLEPGALDAEYERAQLIVLPSRFESFGYVLREALAHGRPVLATPAAGFVGPMADPRAGWLAGGFDAGALRTGLREILADPARLEELLSTASPAEVAHAQRHADSWPVDLLGMLPGWSRREAPPKINEPQTTALVVGHRGDLAATVGSLAIQPTVHEIVVSTDRPERVPRALLEQIDLLIEGPDASALSQTLASRRGSGPILVLQTGERLASATAVAQLQAALQSYGKPAYATAWATGHSAASRPLGGPEAGFVSDYDSAGRSALLTPSAAEAISEDPDPVGRLVAIDAVGVVVPRELFVLPRARPPGDPDPAAGHARALAAGGHDLWSAART